MPASLWAQSAPTADFGSDVGDAATDGPPALITGDGLFLPPPSQTNLPEPYVRPTESQKFHYYAWNAVGPTAYMGATVAAAIDQSFNFPGAWGQGFDAYGKRVGNNLGISIVTASAQYSIGEAFREDTTYYRCTCTGFWARFAHAAISTATSRRGDDGHRQFSPALVAAPLIGPFVAANAWIPTHHGPTLGFHMGEHNLLGQFGQDEALEFLYGGPHTVLGRLQHRFFHRATDHD